MIREILRNKEKKFLGKTYTEYTIYFNGTYLGIKEVCEDGTIFYSIKVKPCIISEANLIISSYIKTDIFTNSIEFSTKEPLILPFGNQLAQIIESEREMSQKAKEYTSLRCIKRYSYNGNGILDCEIYAAPYSDNPCFVVNHFKKEVSACHGYPSSGKVVANKLNYSYKDIL